MASFATPSDLATQLQHDVDTEQAQQLLDMVSAEIRSAAGHTISRVVDDTVTLRVDPRSAELVLPQRPAEAPTVVTVSGYYGPVTPAGWWWNGVDTIGLYPFGTGWWCGPEPAGWFGINWTQGYAWGGTTAAVTYTHGSDDAAWLAVAKAVTLAASTRGLDNPTGVRSESIDDYSRTLAGSAVTAVGASLTDGERALVRQHYGRRLGTVAIR